MSTFKEKVGYGISSLTLSLLISQHSIAEQKVLLVGIDGLQFETLQVINPPNFRRLQIKPAYVGGVTGDASEQETSSPNGWASILTGVWATKHGIFKYEEKPISSDTPSIYKILKQSSPSIKTGCIAYWSVICETLVKADQSFIDYKSDGENDDDIVRKASAFMQSGGDFTFVQLDNVDTVGHSVGFGKQYNASVVDADRQLGILLDKVEQLQAASGDDWLVLVTTDHGRDSKGKDHGAQTRLEKTSFIASNKSLNVEFSSSPAVFNSAFNNLYSNPAVTSIAPTVIRHMGLSLQREWMIDGSPLIGSPGLRKLFKSGSNEFKWLAEGNGKVEVFRNGVLVTTAAQNSGGWADTTAPRGINDYTFVVDETPVSYRTGSDSDVPVIDTKTATGK